MLSKKDILILGMMIFSLFLGAGNIIFPPRTENVLLWFSIRYAGIIIGTNSIEHGGTGHIGVAVLPVVWIIRRDRNRVTIAVSVTAL